MKLIDRILDKIHEVLRPKYDAIDELQKEVHVLYSVVYTMKNDLRKVKLEIGELKRQVEDNCPDEYGGHDLNYFVPLDEL